MKSVKENLDENKVTHLKRIMDFVGQTPGLISWVFGEHLKVTQKTDGKSLLISDTDVEEIISRVDSDGQTFLQVNFSSGKKILLTANFIGFKPAQSIGLDMSRLPKVVTTPDLMSVVDAIEENLNSNTPQNEEVEVLRRVFDAVLRGGESVGFDLTSERLWLQRVTKAPFKASA
ncbi:MAG: hypothetical protein K1X29_07780 [Bdellovibrionales bacterium]|nr:hypothetical protein [Bdellovibrionales bacterium]